MRHEGCEPSSFSRVLQHVEEHVQFTKGRKCHRIPACTAYVQPALELLAI